MIQPLRPLAIPPQTTLPRKVGSALRSLGHLFCAAFPAAIAILLCGWATGVLDRIFSRWFTLWAHGSAWAHALWRQLF